MSIDKKELNRQLDALWAGDQLEVMDTKDQKYAIISDLHMGNGSDADDFHENEPAIEEALKYYKRRDYTLILLGDVEELWQFDLDSIADRYGSTIYRRIRDFGDDNVHRIYGNHDFEWGGFIDPTKSNGHKTVNAAEAIKLKDAKGDVNIFLVHGHQGSVDSDKFTWFSRFFVRLYRGIEPLARGLGLFGHKSATKSQVVGEYERILYRWAKANKVLLMCGHSHRAIFASLSHAENLGQKIAELEAKNAMTGTRFTTKVKNNIKIERLKREWEDERDKGRAIEPAEDEGDPLPCYFNTGCGLYSDGGTAIEIEADTISLVKWSRDETGAKARKVFQSDNLSELIGSIKGT